MLKLLRHMPRRDGAAPELAKEQASLFLVYRRNEAGDRRVFLYRRTVFPGRKGEVCI